MTKQDPSDLETLDLETLPPLMRDRSFWGMTITQFFGAFNDNLFKQMILLIAVVALVGAENEKTMDLQSLAQGIFALPFILFSGFGGYLADRLSKRRIIVLCKVAEILVMLAATVVFFTGGRFVWLLVVLFFMGTQSAFFGPSKYGILPEMVRGRDLPRTNGWIQMTTFLAIIFGTAGAGFLKDLLEDTLWLAGAICVSIAVVGTLTSLLVRRMAPAKPTLKFDVSSLVIRRDTWRILRSDRPLFAALIVSTLFWFVGGIVLLAVNALGKNHLEVGDFKTGLMQAFMGIGIAAGCVAAGKLSAERVSFRLVRLGCWGIVVFGLLLSLTRPDGTHLLGYYGSLVVLVLMGFSAGLFAVPLQVFLQARPPEGQKGRIIGAMNLFNWIGILLSAGVYGLCRLGIDAFSIAHSATFAVTALTLLPVALFYRPKDAELS